MDEQEDLVKCPGCCRACLLLLLSIIAAQDRLRASQRSLAITNLVLLMGVTAGLVAF